MKLDKKDWITISILSILFIIFVFILVGTDYLYGSSLDWNAQHISIPEYFRTLFYDTKELLPNFALNMGAGQNIYNLAYYGFLSPILLISYLLPFINMTYIIIGTSILSILISTALFYKWLKNHGFNRPTIFIASFLFMFSTGMTLHSHRHIMFMNYMPFMILGLFGVDKYFAENKKTLLIISVFLLIMTSYYYSVSGIIALVIYAVYVYLKKTKKFEIKEFAKDGLKFVLPILIAVIMSLVLILPTFYVILNNRTDTTVYINFKDLILPKINTLYIIYRPYGIGLTGISLLALINMFFKKNKEKLFLGITLSLFVLFPLFIFILNGGMYADSKILIPFLPLFVLTIALFLKDIFNKNVNYKIFIPVSLLVLVLSIFKNPIQIYLIIADCIICLIAILLFVKFKKPAILAVPLILISLGVSYYYNQDDKLVRKENYLGTSYQEQYKLINSIIEEDQGIYRISNKYNFLENINRIYENPNFYGTTIYSSTSNQLYNKYYYDIVNNPVQTRNRIITSANSNPVFNMLMNHKYIVSNDNNIPLGYSLYKSQGDFNVYKNEKTLPMAYATSNLISHEEFSKIPYPYNQEYMLNNAIVKERDNVSLIEPTTSISKVDIDLSKVNLEGLEVRKEDQKYIISAKEDTTLNIPLDKTYNNALLFVRFNMHFSQKCALGDTAIYINDIKNTLTCRSWKYHNQNYQFDYQVGLNNQDTLKVQLTKGTYMISGIETYILDFNSLNLLSYDEFNFDVNKTKGDFIVGDINVKEDGYFVTSIPYDKGFKVKVDNEIVDYELVNEAFMGFKIKEGSHHIEISYEAPLRKEALFGTRIGFLIFFGVCIYELRTKRRLKI